MPVALPSINPGDLSEIRLANGTRILWGCTSAEQPLNFHRERVDAVVMHFTLAGTATLRMGALNRSVSIRANQHNLIYPAGEDFWLDGLAAQSGEFLQIHLVASLFGTVSDQHGPAFQQLAEWILTRQPLWLASENLSVTPAMHTVLAQITKCPLTCSLKRLFLEAKVLEVLALQLEQYEHQLTTAETAIPGPEYDKLIEARRVLEARFANPPTLPELSRLVGLNEYKLKKRFKEVFGETIYGWVLNYRLARAYQLLQNHPLTISEVAYQVGYQHPAHFATAFKKKFGVVPSAVQ